jgi:branched-chain amino acid transport system ATP-binding protein
MSQILLEARALRKDFAGLVVVDGVDLQVQEGTVHALIGPNGAGKTTTFNLLTKFIPLSSGQLLYKGQDITQYRVDAVAKLGIVRSFQISSIFASLSLAENLQIALQLHVGQSYVFWRRKTISNWMSHRVEELLAQVGLSGDAHLTAGEVSYGKRRALEIATSLALEPELLLLDEPMSGLGYEDIERISSIIQGFKGKKTVLMVEHNLSVVSAISDQITVLARGKKIAEGDYETISQNLEVQNAYIGKVYKDTHA